MKSTGQLSEEKGKRNTSQAEIQLLIMQKVLSFEENNIFSEIFTLCFTWPSGKAMARRLEGPEFDYGLYLIFFFSSPFL